MNLTLTDLFSGEPEIISYRIRGKRGGASDKFRSIEHLTSLDISPAGGTLYVLSDDIREGRPADVERLVNQCKAKETTGILFRQDHPLAQLLVAHGAEKSNLLIVDVETRLTSTQMCISFLQQINAATRDILDHITEVNVRFAQMSLKNMGIEAMVNYFKEVIGNPVAIYDETFRCLSSTDSYLRMHGRINTTSKNFYLHNLYFSKQKILLQIDGEREREYSLISFPISFRNKVRAYLSILEIHKSITDVDCLILEIAASAILTEMKHSLSIRSIQERNVNSFLYDLFYRKDNRDEDFFNQAEILGVTPSADYVVLVLEASASGSQHLAPRTLSNVLGPTSEDEVLTLAATRIRDMDSRAMVGSLGGSVIAICNLEGSPSELFQAMRQCCHKIKDDLSLYFKESTLRAGIGSVAHGILEAVDSYKNAMNALTYSKMMARSEEDVTVVYEDSIILKLMSSVGSREALEDIIPQSLKTLKEYDEIHQTDLLATLNAYFDCNCNARLAASTMFIHHKTMLYRLNKMAELCKINLADSDERMHLALGIKILKLLSQQDS